MSNEISPRQRAALESEAGALAEEVVALLSGHSLTVSGMALTKVVASLLLTAASGNKQLAHTGLAMVVDDIQRCIDRSSTRPEPGRETQ